MQEKAPADPIRLVCDVACFVTAGLVDTIILVALIAVVIPLLLVRKALDGTRALPARHILKAVLAGKD